MARQTGPGEVRLLGQAAGPLNGDDTEIELRVGAGCRVLVRSSAATIALPSPDGGGAARVRLAAVVGESATVGWLPEPVVAAGSSELELESCWETAGGAELLLREQLVLGRHGERGGDIRSRLLIRRDGRDLLSQSLDTAILDRSGRFAGVVERVIASEVRVGARAGEGPAAATSGRGVAMRPEPGLLVASGCGPTVAEAESQLADALSAGDAVVWE